MDLETALFRIGARRAAKLEAQGLDSPGNDAIKELKKITLSSSSVASSNPSANQLRKPFPVPAQPPEQQNQRSDHGGS